MEQPVLAGTPGGADPHFHKTFSESFYVMEGTVRLFNGEAWIDAVKGDFRYVPQGGINTFSNDAARAVLSGSRNGLASPAAVQATLTMQGLVAHNPR